MLKAVFRNLIEILLCVTPGKYKSTQFSAKKKIKTTLSSRAAVVNLNFRAGSTFPVPGCTVPHFTLLYF